jgi:hypothetical protein
MDCDKNDQKAIEKVAPNGRCHLVDLFLSVSMSLLGIESNLNWFETLKSVFSMINSEMAPFEFVPINW